VLQDQREHVLQRRRRVIEPAEAREELATRDVRLGVVRVERDEVRICTESVSNNRSTIVAPTLRCSWRIP